MPSPRSGTNSLSNHHPSTVRDKNHRQKWIWNRTVMRTWKCKCMTAMSCVIPHFSSDRTLSKHPPVGCSHAIQNTVTHEAHAVLLYADQCSVLQSEWTSDKSLDSNVNTWDYMNLSTEITQNKIYRHLITLN